MKVVILAGGFGTRLTEETEGKPKPMVEIGGKPILWHIMKHYSHYGFNEFFIALGYKGDVIKRYFLEYHNLGGDITARLGSGQVDIRNEECEDWTVHLVDTGLATMTGGRLKRLESQLGDGPFMLTYGDGVSDINLGSLSTFHYSHGRIATITAIRPPARFGGVSFDGDLVTEFTEKSQIREGWINGGFMVLNPAVFRYLKGDGDYLEQDTLGRLAANKQLAAYRHGGFWQCMDTLRDMRLLENLWSGGNAPWRSW